MRELTRQRYEKIATLIKDGKTAQEIIDETGASRGIISHVAYWRELKVKKNPINNVRRRLTRQLGENPRNDEIVQMRLSGATIQEIGDKFHLSRQRIDQILYSYGYARFSRLDANADKLYQFILEYISGPMMATRLP